MLAFGIRYLNGFAAAAEADDIEQAEWPPHPGRVYMALAAAHFQTGADAAEREALLWLEGSTRGGEVSAPALTVPDGWERSVVRHYVPVNDKAGPSKALLQGLPLPRERQDRTFARTWLERDTVFLAWPDLDPPHPHRAALERLCAKVSRIGHSSSLVQLWLADEDEVDTPNWVPDDDRGVIRLRIPGPGALDQLEQAYNAAEAEAYAALEVTAATGADAKTRRAAKKRLRQQWGDEPPPRRRPTLSLYQGYARATDAAPAPEAKGTVFSPHPVCLRLAPETGAPRALDLAATLQVAGRWREAILSHMDGASEAVRGLLSGHARDGAPLKAPHLAFLPLAFVGHEHADGHLLGMGLALPAGIDRETRDGALRVIGRLRQLRLGRLGLWRATSVTESHPPASLHPATWSAYPAGATHWSTVTPIALDRHPKARNRARHQSETAALIAEACTRTGLPAPREVIVTRVSAHLGVPPAFAFPSLKRKDGSDRRHSHAILVFDQPVTGPLLIGAGRFRGYGMCRPMDR